MIRIRVWVLLVLFASMKVVTSLKCYNTDTDTSDIEECQNEYSDEHICVKLVMPPLDDILATNIRRCEIKGSCGFARREHCFECETDLCNSSLVVIPSLLTVIAFCLTKFVL